MNAVDTDVLIYACDQTDVRRQHLALDLITTTPDCVLRGRWPASSSPPVGS